MRNLKKKFAVTALLLTTTLAISTSIAVDPIEGHKPAVKSDAEAQYQLGTSILKGTRFPGDEAKGLRLIENAADQGLAKAQFALGLYYRSGIIVEANPAKAMEWFKKAADQGHSGAETNLGMGYITGNGVEKDTDKGLAWIKRAVDQSDAQAEATIAALYFAGWGVKKDYEQGAKWATLAAKQRNAMGQSILGTAYLRGDGVEKNIEKGLALHRLAAAQGDPTSADILRRYQEQQQANANLKRQAQHYRKHMESQGGINYSAPTAPTHFSQEPSMPPQTTSPPALPSYGGTPGYDTNMPGYGASTSSPGNRPIGESATLQGQESAGGGYQTCYYITGAGYRFTTTSKSSCPSPVTVDPQSGQSW